MASYTTSAKLGEGIKSEHSSTSGLISAPLHWYGRKQLGWGGGGGGDTPQDTEKKKKTSALPITNYEALIRLVTILHKSP